MLHWLLPLFLCFAVSDARAALPFAWGRSRAAAQALKLSNLCIFGSLPGCRHQLQGCCYTSISTGRWGGGDGHGRLHKRRARQPHSLQTTERQTSNLQYTCKDTVQLAKNRAKSKTRQGRKGNGLGFPEAPQNPHFQLNRSPRRGSDTKVLNPKQAHFFQLWLEKSFLAELP